MAERSSQEVWLRIQVVSGRIVYQAIHCVTILSIGSLVPRLISQASITCAFHTASDKSLGDKPGNEATPLGQHCQMVDISL